MAENVAGTATEKSRIALLPVGGSVGQHLEGTGELPAGRLESPSHGRLLAFNERAAFVWAPYE